MFIDLLDINKKYRGIQRDQNSLFNSKMLFLKKYNDLLVDERIPFTIENTINLLKLSSLINFKKNKEISEIILYGRKKFETAEVQNVKFLGLDVSGDSMYISPIKTIFFENNNLSIYSEAYKLYYYKLNENGLFTEESDAILFSKYIFSHTEDLFESDGMMVPVWVYCITQEES